MNEIFYIDYSTNDSKTYSDLFSDIKQENKYTNICQYDNFYKVFKHIVTSILLDKEVVLLDSDFTISEKEDLLSDVEIFETEYSFENEIDFNHLKKKISESNSNWKITLFTSGTTGKPKKISHSKSTLIDNIRINEKRINDIWGYAYSPTHMAGLQVFLQALLNHNTIVKLFGLPKTNIISSILKNKVTHLSATPTFYKLLLPKETSFDFVQNVTFGGEKLPETLKNQLSELFPKAKFLNIYASTEAGALFAAHNDTFKIKPNLQSYVKVENDVLYVHKDKVGHSDNIQFENEWYNTGDIVEIVEENPLTIRFISRKNEMINVGGYKVNPHEVENLILTFEEITEVKVYSRPNSVLGNMICADIVLTKNKSLTKQELIQRLKNHLQDFKIPRIIKFVETIEKTKTGKIKRA